MPKRIIAVLGDYYHEKDIAVKSLEKAMLNLRSKLNEEIEITYTSVEDLVASLTKEPDLVILFAENRLNPDAENIETWMTSEDASRINEYVEHGGSFLAWHSGLASYENIVNYMNMLKGRFLSHPDEHQLVTYKTSSEINNQSDYAFLDEHYFVKVQEEKTDVFLTSHSVDGESIAGWRHEYGKGKVLCLVPAHLKEGLLNESFIQTLSKSLKWCL